MAEPVVFALQGTDEPIGQSSENDLIDITKSLAVIRAVKLTVIRGFAAPAPAAQHADTVRQNNCDALAYR